MFDLITENIQRPLLEPSVGSRVVVIIAHVAAVAAVIVVPLTTVVAIPRQPATTMAFIADAVPPAPPVPAAPRTHTQAEAPQPIATAGRMTTPIDAPPNVQPQPDSVRDVAALAGVEGGVDGGVAGGAV